MPQPILDPNTGEIIGYAPDDGTWGGISAAQAAGINAPPSGAEKGLIDELNKLQLSRIKEQSDQVAKSQRQLEALQSAPEQVDIAPLLALSDSWFGTNMAQHYKRPESANQHQERLLALENKISAQRSAVTDDERKLLEANLRDKLAAARAKGQGAALHARMAQMAGGKPVPANLSAEIGGINASYSALDDILKLGKDNSDIMGPAGPGLISSALGYLQVGERGKRAASLQAELDSRAQLVGKYLEGGKLTDADIARYKASLPLMSDSPEVLQTKVDNLKRLVAKVQASQLDALKGAGYNTTGFNRAEVPPLPDKRKSSAPAAAAAKPDYNKMSDAELEALLQQRSK